MLPLVGELYELSPAHKPFLGENYYNGYYLYSTDVCALNPTGFEVILHNSSRLNCRYMPPETPVLCVHAEDGAVFFIIDGVVARLPDGYVRHLQRVQVPNT